MAIVVAAIVVLGTLAALNLLLTAAIIRRLRTYERERTAFPMDPGLPVGGEPAPFTARTTRDEEVSAESLAGRTALVGFFSTDCDGCLPKAPGFAQAARARTAKGAGALAVISLGQREPADLLTALGEDVPVVLEPDRGPVARAFALGAYPWFFVVGPDRTVLASAAAPEACLAEPGVAETAQA